MNINCESTWKEGYGKIYDNSSHHYIIDTNINQNMGKKESTKHQFRVLFSFFQTYEKSQFHLRTEKLISLQIKESQNGELKR